jgi:H+/Cl- antiporter ClcA
MQKKDYIIQLLKYIIMAIVVGIIVGTIDALFGRVLIAISEFRTIHYQYLLPFLPIAGLVITAMYYVFSKLSLKGMKLIFEVGQQKTDAIPLLLIPLVMIGTWLTHLFGGSAGREGVAVQIGATLHSEEN